MGNKSNQEDNMKGRKEEILEALLGDDDELTEEGSCEEYLYAMEIEPSKLVFEFKEYLEDKARKIRMENGIISTPIQEALSSLRAHIKENDPMNIEPAKYIDNLLLGNLPGPPFNQAAMAFRKKEGEELTEKDHEIIDSLKSELESEEE